MDAWIVASNSVVKARYLWYLRFMRKSPDRTVMASRVYVVMPSGTINLPRFMAVF